MAATKQRVTKRALTVPEAADQFERVEKELAKLKSQREEAVAVLKRHFEKTGRSTYKDRIAYSETSSLILDQPKVREYLGRQLAKFQKRVTRRSVTLLNRAEEGSE